MSNGKTYTEVLIDVYEKIDNVEQRIVKRLDTIVKESADYKAALAKGEAKFKAIDDKLDGKSGVNERIGKNTDDIETNENNITKVRNINISITALLSALAGFVGLQR